MQNIKPLPDLSGWHPLPDDATVPEGMPIATRGKDNGVIAVYPTDKWAANPAKRHPATFDYFTPEPVQSPESSLPTEPGTWIEATTRGGTEVMLKLTDDGSWFRIANNGSVVWVPASHIEDWREVKWVPANEPEVR